MVTLQLPVFLRLSWGSLVREFTVDARFWQQSWHKFLSVPNATRARGGAGCRYQVPASRMVRMTSWSRIWTCPYQEIVSKVR